MMNPTSPCDSCQETEPALPRAHSPDGRELRPESPGGSRQMSLPTEGSSDQCKTTKTLGMIFGMAVLALLIVPEIAVLTGHAPHFVAQRGADMEKRISEEHPGASRSTTSPSDDGIHRTAGAERGSSNQQVENVIPTQHARVTTHEIDRYDGKEQGNPPVQSLKPELGSDVKAPKRDGGRADPSDQEGDEGRSDTKQSGRFNSHVDSDDGDGELLGRLNSPQDQAGHQDRVSQGAPTSWSKQLSQPAHDGEAEPAAHNGHQECKGGAPAVCECLFRCPVFADRGSADDMCRETGVEAGSRKIIAELITHALDRKESACQAMQCVTDCAAFLRCLDSEVQQDCRTMEKLKLKNTDGSQCRLACS